MTGLSASRLAFPEAVSRPGLWFKVLRPQQLPLLQLRPQPTEDRKSTRLNSSHSQISYAVFCLKKKKNTIIEVVSRNLSNHVYPRYPATSCESPPCVPIPSDYRTTI